MKEYGFYGWETADMAPKDRSFTGINDPRDLYDALLKIWCADTCAPRMRKAWSRENPALGQCSVTAFLARDIFGGKVLGIPREDGSFHCYNVVDGRVFDLTSEQFGNERLCYGDDPEQLKEEHFANEEKRLRYEKLRSLLWDRQDEIENAALKWEIISNEHLIKDEWIDLRRSSYRFPDGTVFEPFYSYSRRDYVVIVARDEDERYICVRQYRQGIENVTTEFPAGGIERSDGCNYRQKEGEDGLCEDSLKAAKRELLEETGYESDEWTHLLSIPSNATIADNNAHIFMAKGCRRVAAQRLDETEFLNVKLLTENDLMARIYKGDFKQSVHVMAWLLAKDAGRDGQKDH